jgi:hypothetical protein
MRGRDAFPKSGIYVVFLKSLSSLIKDTPASGAGSAVGGFFIACSAVEAERSRRALKSPTKNESREPSQRKILLVCHYVRRRIPHKRTAPEINITQD